MATGQVESWAGNISDMGPIYPFVGSEVLWFIVGLALWGLWHVLQIIQEKRAHREEVDNYGSTETLQRLVAGETPDQEVY